MVNDLNDLDGELTKGLKCRMLVIMHCSQYFDGFLNKYLICSTFDLFRVNFLKYQKPEKDLSFIKESETYRMIHNLDRPENGIEKRPERVAAEEDILKVKRLIHKMHASPFPFL